MNKKRIALLIAHKDYQAIEYGIPKEIFLTDGSFEVVTVSNKSGIATAHDQSTTQVDCTLEQIDAQKIDGLFVIGGPGALTALDTLQVYELLRNMMDLHKPFGAICISSRILAKAGVLGGKKATGWDEDHALEDIFKYHAVTYSHDRVTVDGNIVTAVGPLVADQFAWKIIQIFKGLHAKAV